MGLSQVLQLIQNRVHPSQRGGVPITKTFRRESTGIEDVPATFAAPVMGDAEAMPITAPVSPSVPFVPRTAPQLDASGSNALLSQAQAILAGLGNNPAPQIQSPNNESIALALLPAILGAGTNYIGALGQGYMAGQNQELARIEQERRRREQNIIRQAQGLQNQAGELATRENLLFNQQSQNFRNEADNERMREISELGADTRMSIAEAGNQTRSDIASGAQGIQRDRLELDREKVEVGNAAKLWTIALKEANMDGSVTAEDVKRLEALRMDIGGDRYASMLAIPPIGSSWAKIKNDADMIYKELVLAETKRRNQASESVANRNAATREKSAETAVTRENRLSGVLGGGDSQAESFPTVSRKEAGRQVATANGKIKELRAKQRVEGDTKKRARYEIEIQGLAARRDYYQSLLNGEVPPMNPGEPKTDAAKQAAEKARASGAGIPLSESFAAGGSGRQRTQAEIDAAKKVKVQSGKTDTGKNYTPRGR